MESDYPADEEMIKCEFDEPKTPTPQPSPKRKPPGEQGLLSVNNIFSTHYFTHVALHCSKVTRAFCDNRLILWLFQETMIVQHRIALL